MKKFLAVFIAFYCATSAFAADAPAWKINAAQSKLEFKTKQDDADIVGYFKKFSGKINFDKNQLAQSKITIEVEINSIVISMVEASATVQSPEWLSSKAFPKATFTAEKFSKNKSAYRAEGNLTIKGKTAPVILDFTFEETAPNKARAIGKTTIKRSAFGVGDADVKKANGVKDEVEVMFTVNAEK